MKRAFAAFVRLSRLKFLAGGVGGALLGTAIAAYESGTVSWRAYALAQAAIAAFQLMTHYSNDYFDRAGDAAAIRTPFSGGSGALVDGSLPPILALRAALACAAAGCAVTLALWLAAGKPLAALIGLAIAILAWSYSAPPLRLLARGLGEADTALVVAVLVPLCAFAAQRGFLDERALMSALPGAAAMFAMMLAVEYPDIAADAASGKRTLLVRFGVRGGQQLGVIAVCAVYVAAASALLAGAPPAYALLEACSLPLAAAFIRSLVRHVRGGAGAETLAGSGVAFFFIVTLYGLLGYAPALLPRSESGAARETKRTTLAVETGVIQAPTLEERINAALDEVRPAIHRDGGDVWLIEVRAGIAYVQMVGACGGCAMSTSTLKGAVETIVRTRCPEIARVEQV